MKTYRKLAIPYFVWISMMIVIPMILIMFMLLVTPTGDIIQIRFTLDHLKNF